MGIPNKPVTVRWSDAQLEVLRRIGEAFDPQTHSHTRIMHGWLAGFWAFLMTDKMPRWMVELKAQIRNSCPQESTAYTDSPTPEMAGQIGLSGVAGDAGRAALRSAKRPPCKFSAPRTTGRAVGAVAVQVDAWPAPFCGHGPFAALSPQRIA